jgi:hypothetical protein
MGEYTPTTEEVRGDYAHFQIPTGGSVWTAEFDAGLAEFDRWLTAHDREVVEAVVVRIAETVQNHWRDRD